MYVWYNFTEGDKKKDVDLQIASWTVGDLNQSWLAQAQTRHNWLKKVPEKQLGKQLGYVTLGGVLFCFVFLQVFPSRN